MLPEKPLPIAARFYTADLRMEVDFDHELNPGPLGGANWSCRAANDRYVGVIVPGWNAVGKTAIGHVSFTFAEVGIDKCQYAPPPFDVKSRYWLKNALAFDDFPLTVLP